MSAEVMIHACKDRAWYVNDFLIPSMLEQGIKEEQITLWMDDKGNGCLKQWLNSCEYLKDKPGGTWHVQDDVLIASDFAEKIEKYDKGIVCGFCHDLYETEGVQHLGYQLAFLMWQSSFPCIRIPNEVLGHFYKWFYDVAVHDKGFQKYIKTGKCDDTIFRLFMCNERSADIVYNLAPHLVEHVDYLIGGSQVNQWRGYAAMGAYFYDDYLVDNLIEKIAKRRARKRSFFI